VFWLTSGINRRKRLQKPGYECQVAREAVGCTPLLALFTSLKPAICISFMKHHELHSKVCILMLQIESYIYF
jgi:hypothetical protein